MLKRTITAAVALMIFIPILFFSDTIVFDIIISIISAISALEFLQCAGLVKIWAVSLPSLAVSVAIPMTVRTTDIRISVMIFVVYMFILLYSLLFAQGRHDTRDAATAFLSTVYTVVTFAAVLITRSMRHGEYIFALIFIGAWITDTFAYFCGRFFGRHKLIPVISPKKTVEGAIGGTLFCIASFVVFGYVVSAFISDGPEPHYILLAVTGLFTAVAAQLGDLCASAIKRNFGVKDYGTLFPGHGGMLDRFDSVMAAAPFIMFIAAILSRMENLSLFI